MEGPQAVREALAAGGLAELYLEPGRQPEIEQLAHTSGVPAVAVSADVLGALAETVTPQGVVGVGTFVDVDLPTALGAHPTLVVVLHDVADPGNAGAIIRTADAAGASAVLLTGDSVDPHNGKCVRASAGSLWHLPVACGVALPDALAALRDRGARILATASTGASDLDDLLDGDALTVPTAWLFGPEAHGLTTEVLASADNTVRVPLHGRAESLNLAAAAAVCLYASARAQRRARPGEGSS